jgi:hypothetical protein
MQYRRIWMTLLGFVAASIISPAQAVCVQPDAKTFLETSRTLVDKNNAYIYFPSPEAKFLLQTIDKQDVQWMGISWEGPQNGALFLLDCNGTALAHSNLGSIKELKTGPVVPAGQTVEVVYNSEDGTGLYAISTAWVRYDNGTIVTLWKHENSSVVTFPSLGDDYKDTFAWTLSPDGERITVTGKRVVDTVEHDHGWASGTTHDLPTKYYCWSSGEMKFTELGCHP